MTTKGKMKTIPTRSFPANFVCFSSSHPSPANASVASHPKVQGTTVLQALSYTVLFVLQHDYQSEECSAPSRKHNKILNLQKRVRFAEKLEVTCKTLRVPEEAIIEEVCTICLPVSSLTLFAGDLRSPTACTGSRDGRQVLAPNPQLLLIRPPLSLLLQNIPTKTFKFGHSIPLGNGLHSSLPCPALPCHAMPCHAMPYPNLPCRPFSPLH